MALAVKNPHPRDDSLMFDEAQHRYVVGENNEYVSVTSKVKSCFREFDPDSVISSMRIDGEWKPGSKYAGLSPSEVKALWKNKGEEAARLGTEMHEAIEYYFNGEENRLNELEGSVRQQFHKFADCLPVGLVPYRTEWRVWDGTSKTAGTIDMVFIGLDGRLHIYDWKRTERLKYDGYDGACALPTGLQHIPDASFWHYSLQLNVYKLILERCYGLEVSSMRLVCFHPNRNIHEVKSVPLLEEEASVVMRNVV